MVCFNQWGIYAYKVDNLNLENVSSYSNIVGMHFEFSNKHVKNCRMFNNIFNLVIVDSISQEFGFSFIDVKYSSIVSLRDFPNSE